MRARPATSDERLRTLMPSDEGKLTPAEIADVVSDLSSLN